MPWHWRALVVFVLASLIQQLQVESVSAAEPSLIMVYGGSLSEPIVLSDWIDNDWLLSGDMAAVTSDMLEGRPSFQLAFFRGSRWNGYVAPGKPLDALKPEQANQYGRFYPAIGFAEALLAIDFIPGPGTLFWYMRPEGLRLLGAHGVPTTLPFPPGAVLSLVSSEVWPWIGFGLLCIGVFKIAGLQKRKRRARHKFV